MSSRAKGICLGRRSHAPAKGMGAETGHCEKDGGVMVGKPDKMASLSPTQFHSRAATSLLAHSELRGQFARPW
jgi:hypothetical protein